MSGASHFRGHLFADLRGSTAFTEREGNAAGAELVRRFREMVRDEVGRHQGAEVKTEGDAIYVVFASASTAVMCGLALIDRAAEISAADEKLPMHIGVGVHAGEAVEVPEGGYIGTAVNLAARVCAVAGAGEVLVTGTVRGITAASIPVTFVPRGRRRLKGISEPVELYRVVPQGVAVPSARRVSRGLAAAVGAGVVLLLVAGLALAVVTAPRPPVVTPTPAPLVHVPQVGPLAIGQYVLGKFQPRFGFQIADPGWSFAEETQNRLHLVYDQGLGGSLDVGQISTVFTNPCVQDGNNLGVVNTSQDLLEALRGHEFVNLADPQPIFVGDKKGLILDVTIDPGILAACDAAGGVAIFPLGGTNYSVAPGQRFRIHSIDVGESNVSFVSTSNGGPEAPVAQSDAVFASARHLVDSVKF